MPQVRIIASGGLDETAIDELTRNGTPIDGIGVGTKMGVSADAPYLDTAYKLVQYGVLPAMKLSPEKITTPGPKQMFRRRDRIGDILGLRDEAPPDGYERLMEPVMLGGRRVGKAGGVQEAQARFEADLAWLPESVRAITNPQQPPVRLSERLVHLSSQTRAEFGRRTPIAD